MPGIQRSAPVSRRAVDEPTRVCHWLLALCFFGVQFGGDSDPALHLHATLGETMGGLLVFRVLWGALGPGHARRSSPWRRLASLSGWLQGLHAGTPNWRVAQSLGMALVTAGMLLLIGLLVLSGYVGDDPWGGAWLDEVHDTLGQLLLTLVLAHIAFVLGLSVLRRRNMALAMVTGRTDGPGPQLGCHRHRLVAGLVLATVLGFWIWQWRDVPEGRFGDSAAAQPPHGRVKSRHDSPFLTMTVMEPDAHPAG